jgi:hypothetical protein
MRSRFAAGPVPRGEGPYVISFTEFTARRAWVLPGIVREGRRLRDGWWAMPGAIGVSLWFEPGRRRGGALSVWTDEQHLRRFVGLPRHVEVVRRFRADVAVRSTTWTAQELSVSAAFAEARMRLDRERDARAPDSSRMSAP